MALVEVCGFDDWLLEKLRKANRSEIVVIQPDNFAINKTDKRDAKALYELLGNNRKRLAGGQRPNSLQRIFPASPEEAQVRQLANFRQPGMTQRTRIINKIKVLLTSTTWLKTIDLTETRKEKYFRKKLSRLFVGSSSDDSLKFDEDRIVSSLC